VSDKSVRAQAIFTNEINPVCPVQSLAWKYFPSVFQKIWLSLPHPVPARGALRDRHERWARDAMDASRPPDERLMMRTAKACGPGALVAGAKLTGRWSLERRWHKSRSRRGAHDICR